MGFYECIYDCGDGDYCVDCSSSLDDFGSPPSFIVKCKKHTLVKGVKFKYNLSDFIKNFTYMTDGEDEYKSHIYDVEFIEMRYTEVKGGFLPIVQMFVSNLHTFKESKKLFFSVFDDAPSWKFLPDGRIKITLIFQEGSIHRVVSNKKLYWCYKERKVMELSS